MNVYLKFNGVANGISAHLLAHKIAICARKNDATGTAIKREFVGHFVVDEGTFGGSSEFFQFFATL